jgi:hypothetical protein
MIVICGRLIKPTDRSAGYLLREEILLDSIGISGQKTNSNGNNPARYPGDRPG